MMTDCCECCEQPREVDGVDHRFCRPCRVTFGKATRKLLMRNPSVYERDPARLDAIVAKWVDRGVLDLEEAPHA